MKLPFTLESVESHKTYTAQTIRYRADTNEILEVQHSFDTSLSGDYYKKLFTKRLSSFTPEDRSGIWRYRELVLPIPNQHIVTKPEGNTNLYSAGQDVKNGFSRIGDFCNINSLYLKHEGENPTGSFKDRGMTVGISMAHYFGAKAVACASTGNTSASLASYAAQAGMTCFVFIPQGKISSSKLSQSIAYGAITVQVQGDFDTAMQLVEEVCNKLNIYLLNSVNPFRIEGQKTIAFELLQQLNWEVPDWIVLPGGNLGNTSAIGKALRELKQLGIISRLPRVATIQAEGANPFYRSYKTGFKTFTAVEAETVATAIRIGNPVSYVKARKTIEETNGVVEQVSDIEILQAKTIIDTAGIGCEPASATTIAGIKKLVHSGIIDPRETVAGILTGHVLKDPDNSIKAHSNARVLTVKADTNTIVAEVERYL